MAPRRSRRAPAWRLGTTVQIGHIEAATERLDADRINCVMWCCSTASADRRCGLPRVTAALSPRSLLTLDLRLEQMLIEGAELEVRRDALGRLYVGGLDFSGAAIGRRRPGPRRTGSSSSTSSSCAAVRCAGSTSSALAPPLALTEVSLVVRNGVRHHDIRLDATPPAGWGERFSVQGRFTQPLLGRTAATGGAGAARVNLDLPRADVSELRRYVSLPFELSEGEGALRAWLEVADGEPRELTLDMALRSVAMRLASHVAPLGFEQVEGRLSARRTDDGVTRASAATRLRHRRRAALAAQRPDARAGGSGRGARRKPVTGGEFSAQPPRSRRDDADRRARAARRCAAQVAGRAGAEGHRAMR